MSAGLEESADVLNTIYHTVTVGSGAHRFSLLDGRHPAKTQVWKKDPAKRILFKLFMSMLLEAYVRAVWPA